LQESPAEQAKAKAEHAGTPPAAASPALALGSPAAPTELVASLSEVRRRHPLALPLRTHA
jgi:hypothetical protein